MCSIPQPAFENQLYILALCIVEAFKENILH